MKTGWDGEQAAKVVDAEREVIEASIALVAAEDAADEVLLDFRAESENADLACEANERWRAAVSALRALRAAPIPASALVERGEDTKDG